MRTKSIWALLVGMACLCAATSAVAKSDAVDNGYYTTKDKEFYLTPEQLLFIRPGLEITILDVAIPADMQPEITYSITDPAGLPLDHDGVFTPGTVDMRFTLANIPMGEEQKVRLAYERISRNGTLTTLGDGMYKYKMDLVLDSNQDTTHTLVLGGRRDLREFDLDRYADNAVKNWVPSAMYDPVPRDIVSTETCNRCHDKLQEHGRWQSPQACTNCHNPTRNTRFDALIHAVHSGGEAGGHDFSEIVYPAEISDCQVCHAGGTPTEAFPLVANPSAALVCDGSGVGTTSLTWAHTGNVEIKVATTANPDGTLFAMEGPTGSVDTGKWVSDGTKFMLYDAATQDLLATVPVNGTVLGCVGNAPGAPRGVAAAQHTNWLDHPSRVVCGSCHEHSDIDFENGVGHPAQGNDNNCGFCHGPGIGEEFTASITGAHAQLYKSPQFPGVKLEFVSVTDTGPGDTPTVTFSIESKYGFIDVNSLNRLRFSINGPNEDYSYYVRESVSNAVNVEGNVWKYTFATPLPGDAAGSYSIGVEGRASVPIDFGDEVSNERDVIQATTMEFAVTDDVAVPRRVVVEDEKCESCHVNLALHGGGRTNANYCITCHMPSLLDIATPAENVSMKWMVHKIHRGADLENGYVVVRSRGTYDFSEVGYPADLRNCEACHVNNSQQIPVPAGALPTLTPKEWWSPIMPQAAACLGCHDGDSATAHAYANTTFFGESCSTCHGEGKEASVDRVHAR